MSPFCTSSKHLTQRHLPFILESVPCARAQIFNILCEQPETVAAFLVPRARTIAARREAWRYVRFLTLPRAAARFITAPLRAHRFFGADGARALAALVCCPACRHPRHTQTPEPHNLNQKPKPSDPLHSPCEWLAHELTCAVQ